MSGFTIVRDDDDYDDDDADAARAKRTIEILRLLRQLADHPAAPPGRALYVNEAADEIARHYGIRA